MARVKLSIVTPVLNRRAMIGEALASLRAQHGTAFEHVVVDGGSTDGTRDLVAAEPGCRLIEAPGSSIYEAINLGIAGSGGNVIGLLNSDDAYPHGVLSTVAAAFAAEPRIELVHGSAHTVLADGGPAGTHTGELTAGPLDLRRVLLGVPAINACFFSRDLFVRVGPFDPALRISADRDWLARALLAKPVLRRLDRVLYLYRMHPGSLTIDGRPSAARAWVGEHLTIARRQLRDPALPPEARRTFAAFHGKQVAHQAFLALRSGEPATAAAVLAQGFRVRPAWPVEALPPLLAVLSRRLRRAATDDAKPGEHPC